MKTVIKTKVTAWGNSYGLRLPKEFVNQNRDFFNSILEVSMDNKTKKISLEPEKSEVKSVEYFIEQIKKMKKVRIKEFDWGPPVGKEIW